MPLAIEHIRRMRGGAQAHLMRCSDGHYYVVKFQNNPQHPRILVNELLATRVAASIGLPTVPVAVIEVRKDLIELTDELSMHLGNSRTPCRAGFQFGSRYPGEPGQVTVFDFLPDDQLDGIENLADFAGMLVFDKWACNTNGRQVIFFRDSTRPEHPGPWTARMIDQGFCFNAGEWSFDDAPLRGLYARARVYSGVSGMRSFEPWLARMDQRVNERLLDEIVAEIPGEWYGYEQDSLYQMLERLEKRKKRVPELILGARDSSRQPFPNWK
jgi:hypothetical protein